MSRIIGQWYILVSKLWNFQRWSIDSVDQFGFWTSYVVKKLTFIPYRVKIYGWINFIFLFTFVIACFSSFKIIHFNFSFRYRLKYSSFLLYYLLQIILKKKKHHFSVLIHINWKFLVILKILFLNNIVNLKEGGRKRYTSVQRNLLGNS